MLEAQAFQACSLLVVIISNPPSRDLGCPRLFSLVLLTTSDPPSHNLDCGLFLPLSWF
jgi:hypothetical protein